MMRPLCASRLYAPFLLAVLACCARSPKTTFHTLSVEAHEGSSSPEVARRIKSLGVGPITLPALLEQSGVVLRKNHYTVEISSTHEWGGRLVDELLRTLARQLARLLPGTRVLTVPWETAQAPEVQVTLSLDRFDGSVGGKAVLWGRWVLQRPKDGLPIAAHRVSLEQEVKGRTVEAVVQAQSRLVARLGEIMGEYLRSPAANRVLRPIRGDASHNSELRD